MQPVKMKDPAFVDELRSYGANLQVVVAFRMLPEVVWAMPKYGTFNVHAALLPQYRGAAPINWAVINGETRTGISTFFLDHDIDTGRVIMREPFDIKPDFDAGDVYDGLMRLGAEVCLRTLGKIVEADGHPEAIAQDELSAAGEVLHAAPKIFKETCMIDWKKPAEAVRNFIRGLSPHPGAWTTLVAADGKRSVLKVYSAEPEFVGCDCEPGTMLRCGRQLGIAAGGGKAVVIRELQAAGKRRMASADFLNGMKDIESCRAE